MDKNITSLQKADRTDKHNIDSFRIIRLMKFHYLTILTILSITSRLRDENEEVIYAIDNV